MIVEKHDAQTLRLSQEELLLILMRARLPLLVGINRQLTELPREQLNLMMGTAERALLAREFLRPDEKASLVIEPVVLAMVGACAEPERSIVMLRAKTDEANETMTVNFARQMTVLHVPVPPGIHVFTALRDREAAARALVELTGVTKQPVDPMAGPVPDGELSEKALVEARDLIQARKMVEAGKVLEANLPLATARGLTETMAALASDTTFMAVDTPTRPEAKNLGGFTLLQGGTNAFILNPKTVNGERVFAVQVARDEALTRALEGLF
jgi:hypothetical protein